MSKYHDHRSDCPFKFAPLDVCDCVEHNMLDHIEQLVADNKSLIKELKICRMAQAVMDNTVAELEREVDEWKSLAEAAIKDDASKNIYYAELKTKLAKAVEGLREIAGFAEKEWVTPSGEAPPDVQNLCDIARALLAEIEGEKE